jgi:ABC-type polysaccharide/polyol phosphate export permease
LQVNEFCWYHPGVPARIPGSYFARNLITSKSLLFQLVKRDLQQKYVGSAAGWVWSIIHPLVLWASYVFIFQYCLHATLEGGLTTSYPLNLFIGMLPWFLFSDTVLRASSSIVEHANLITKTMFPSEILPVSIFLSSLASHLVVTVIAAVVACFIQGNVNPALALLPVWMLIVGLFSIGVGWIAAALQVYLRDTAQLVVVAMTFWFWLTPIFIQEEKFPVWAHWVLRWNPMAYVVRAYRVMLLGRTPPTLHDVAAAAGFAVAAFVLGGLFFRHMKKGFADVL